MAAEQLLRDMDTVIAEATHQGVQLHRLQCSSSLAAAATAASALPPAHGSPRATHHVEAVAELSERVVALTEELAAQRSAHDAAQARTSALKRHLADAVRVVVVDGVAVAACWKRVGVSSVVPPLVVVDGACLWRHGWLCVCLPT